MEQPNGTGGSQRIERSMQTIALQIDLQIHRRGMAVDPVRQARILRTKQVGGAARTNRTHRENTLQTAGQLVELGRRHALLGQKYRKRRIMGNINGIYLVIRPLYIKPSDPLCLRCGSLTAGRP